MHRLFGKKKEVAPPPTLGDASGSINARVTDIEKKIAGLDNDLRKYKEALKKAKGTAATNIKKRAMDTLKRKRMYEQQRDQLQNQAFNIDQTSFAIETVQNTQTTVAAMAAASKQLKKEHKKIDINEIENMQDEMEDLLEDVGEISEILGRSYGVPDDIEEADLDAELACLEDELEGEDIFEAEETAAPTATSTYAPSSPTDIYSSAMPAQPVGSVFSGAERTSTTATAAAPTASTAAAQPYPTAMSASGN